MYKISFFVGVKYLSLVYLILTDKRERETREENERSVHYSRRMEKGGKWEFPMFRGGYELAGWYSPQFKECNDWLKWRDVSRKTKEFGDICRFVNFPVDWYSRGIVRAYKTGG